LTSPPDAWKPDEQELRKKEVRNQKWTGIAQAVASLATVGAVIVAVFVALQGQQSLKTATQYNLQQAQDNQFSTALTSLGSGDVTERIAGLVLLELNAADRLTPASSVVFGKPSAYNYYTTALEIYSGYLRSHGVGSQVMASASASPGASPSASASAGTQPFGPGYGTPPAGAFTIDIQYAADEVVKMLELKNQVRAVSAKPPNFDLSNDELYEVNFTGMDLSWVNAYMVGIDLRGAVLEQVTLNKLDDLEYSHLQCADLKSANLRGADLEDANLAGADLEGAHLQRANLTGADLQGAYVQGANFSGARHSQAELTTMYGTATGLPPTVVTIAGSPKIQPPCLMNKNYGDAPMPSPTPTPSPSATPSKTAAGRKP
jgi:Pentapeptide repeats (8 copies)